MNNISDSVYEQTKIVTELNKICMSRRAPHAFIFSGPEGVGKFNTAIQFAKSFSYALNPSTSELTLQRITELQEPYVKLILPLPRGKNESSEDSGVEKLSKETLEEIQSEIKTKIKNPFHRITIENANNIKISSIREIKKFINLQSGEEARFIIILEAHLMNEQAQNALLKSLEEPPENVYFILLTANKEMLLPTVISRSRELAFEPLSKKMIAKLLVDNFTIDKNLALKVSAFSDGSVQKALKLIEYDIDKVVERTITILRFAFAKRYQAALEVLTVLNTTHAEESISFLLRMIRFWLTDTIKNRNLVEEYYFESFRETFEKFNQRYSTVDLGKLFTNLENLENMSKRNVNLNVLFLNIIFELAAVVKRN